jgi:hypothetical protein
MDRRAGERAVVFCFDDQRDLTRKVIDLAAAWFADHGVTIQQAMTDNGAPYRSTA